MNDNYFNRLSEVYKVLLPDSTIKEYGTFDANEVFNELITTSDSYSTLYKMVYIDSLIDIWKSDIRPIFLEGGIECSLREIDGDKKYAIFLNSENTTTNMIYIIDKGLSESLYYIDNIGYTKEELIDYVLKWALSVLD